MTAALEVRDVVVAFGGIRAVDEVSLAVEPGTVVGLIGPNGSGKTTLLDVIAGQLRPTSGTVLLDGEDLRDHAAEDRAAIGLTRSFQDCRLFPQLTVEETLLLAEDARQPAAVLTSALRTRGARAAEARKHEATESLLAAFGLARFRHHLIGELSTGTRRVVDLATIVAARPRLLLLDEPTAGIAQREAEAFVPLLRRLHAITGATIVLVEHDVPLTMALCDRLVVLETGRVVCDGTPAEVVDHPAAIEAYLGASQEALARSGLVATKTAPPAPTRPPRRRNRPLRAAPIPRKR